MTWTAADVDRSIPDAFQQQVNHWPDKPALAGSPWQPTFAELDTAANWHAHALLGRCGGGPGRIALLLTDDGPLVAAVLGVLKAGKTAVVLNPTDPPARLEQILLDARPQLVLTEAQHAELALRVGVSRSDVMAVAERLDDSTHAAPEVKVEAAGIAFVIYTSGSTGGPKGVIQTHRSLLHKVLRLTNELALCREDRLPLLTSMSGSSGITLMCSVLLNGATLCPFPVAERGMAGLAAWVADQEITVVLTSASVFRHFVRTLDERAISGIRLVCLGGEPVLSADVAACHRHFGQACEFANLLASTEAGSVALHRLAADADLADGALPVGRPVQGVEVWLVDHNGAPVPPGQTGEIVVCGEHLSPGYWGDEALTAERFAEHRSRRLFRSGDLGRMSASGVLTVVGRKDLQVKVRGNRISVSEVETAIAAQPEVDGAVVCATSTHRGDTRLTGYVMARPGARLSSATLRRALGTTLPERELPTEFVFLDAFPLTSRGKVDRDRLARIPPPTAPSPRIEEPMSETEALLGEIWSRALEMQWVGREEDFFELGGDSLTAAVIAAGVYASIGVELELSAIAENSSVATMAALVERLRAEAVDADRPTLTRTSRASPLPLSFAQERVWRSAATPEGRLGHNLAIALRIRGPLAEAALRQSLEDIVRRHEALRTTITELDGRLSQVIHPARPFDLPLIDFSAAPDPSLRAAELLARDAHTVFDLERGPLLRLRLVRLADDEHWLLRVVHHIISDAWSWRLFLDELVVLYAAYRRGRPSPLVDQPLIHYGDFAVWERNHLNQATRRYKEQVRWWAQKLGNQHGPPLKLPCARAEPPEHPPEPSKGLIWWGLKPEVSRELARLARDAHATHYMVRLALFSAQLAIETGRSDLILGAYMTNRRLVELQKMIGDFTNLTTLVLRFHGNPTCRQWVARVRAAVLETSTHSELPYEHLREELRRDGIAVPEIRAVFGTVYERPPLRVGDLELTSLPARLQVTPTGFTFLVNPHYEAERCQVYFDVKSYDPEQVHAFIGRYQHLATQATAYFDRPLGELARSGASV